MSPRRFDAEALAARLRAALEAEPRALRELGAAIGVSAASLSRAASGWPDLSHENYLRITAWLEGLQQERAA